MNHATEAFGFFRPTASCPIIAQYIQPQYFFCRSTSAERWSVHSNPVATSQSYLETNRRLTAATGLQCLRQAAPSTRK